VLQFVCRNPLQSDANHTPVNPVLLSCLRLGTEAARALYVFELMHIGEDVSTLTGSAGPGRLSAQSHWLSMYWQLDRRSSGWRNSRQQKA